MKLRHWTCAVLASSLVSCELAPIAEPAERDVEESFAVVDDWPKVPPGFAFGRVLGVAVAPDGRIWVSHTADGGPRNEAPIRGATLAVFDPDSGALLAEHGAGMFQLPHALAFDDEGLLWVTDSDANTLVVLDPNGNVVRRIEED